MTNYDRWYLQNNDLKDLSPQKVGDIIIKCFFEAQKETFIQANDKYNIESNDTDILERVTSVVWAAFNQINADFNDPTKETLTQVIQILAKASDSWGTPKDIIEHHKKQIQKALIKLK